MAREDRIKEKLNDPKFIEEATKKFLEGSRVIEINFTKHGQPENYVRERYTSRGNRFYNAKEALMRETAKELKQLVSPENRMILDKLVVDPTAEYYVEMEADFYIKIPNADSIEKTVLKERGIIKPATRPDLDNYDKYIIDTLHGVIYDDDKRVISIKTNKLYSINPRTELKIKIIIL
jgi:Holliday junction resolvase RusA-like endonuclease